MEDYMGEVVERITLVNTVDAGMAARGLIKETELRKTKLRALVDPGATNLVISEKTRQKLGLAIIETGGVIPLEQMDLIVDLVEQKLAGKHGDDWVRYVRKTQRR
jgi:hypothetical protein